MALIKALIHDILRACVLQNSGMQLTAIVLWTSVFAQPNQIVGLTEQQIQRHVACSNLDIWMAFIMLK